MPEVLALTGPIFLVIAAGYATTRAGLFQRAEMRVFGKYVINIALPALLFNALSRRSVAEVLNPVFVAGYALASLATMFAGLLWARRFARKPLSASAIVGMGMSCPNSGFIGFPLVAQVFGAATGGIALALAMVVENFLLLPLALAIADMEVAEGPGESPGAHLLRALAQSVKALSRNPMIWGIAAGFAFSLFGWQLPVPVARGVDLLAASCGAISLFVIGGSLVGIQLHGLRRDVAVVAAGKLLLHPLAAVAVLALLPPMARELQVALVLLCAVPMLGIYPILAQRHGHDAFAAAAQLGTTVVSFFTLTALLFVVHRSLS